MFVLYEQKVMPIIQYAGVLIGSATSTKKRKLLNLHVRALSINTW